MSCTPLLFTQTHTILGSFGISITITVPEIYNCTNIQLRLRSAEGIVRDWFDYAVLSDLVTTINFAFDPTVCYIDVRLNQCCPKPPPNPDDPETPLPPGDPGPSAEEPPCAVIAVGDDECTEQEFSVTNPYVKPSDISIDTPYNDILIPKKVSLTITQNSCSDVSALLCAVRCGSIVEETGQCPCNFTPWVDINTLPQLTIGRLPYGVPLDIDTFCNYQGSYRSRPDFELPKYTRIEAYTKNYGFIAIPFIDGIGYDYTNLNRNTLTKIYTCENSVQLRSWLVEHFRFLGIDSTKTSILNNWPYTDLYWYPYDFCISQLGFTPEEGVAYVNVVPC